MHTYLFKSGSDDGYPVFYCSNRIWVTDWKYSFSHTRSFIQLRSLLLHFSHKFLKRSKKSHEEHTDNAAFYIWTPVVPHSKFSNIHSSSKAATALARYVYNHKTLPRFLASDTNSFYIKQ